MKNDSIDKNTLYESVKMLVECEQQHIHLHQQKLFTLFSIAFQYILFNASKTPGHYIIRVEDSFLADKLARKAKDENSRKFMQKLILPRRLAVGQSFIHLDFFSLNSWPMTKDLPREKIKGALVVKNTSQGPVMDETDYRMLGLELPEDYFLTSLTEFVPKVIYISFEDPKNNLTPISFEFIQPEEEDLPQGLMIKDIEIIK